jgi:nitroreductase
MLDSRETITKAILRSQHCQRNWDLSQEIPEEDLELLYTAATQCPSKQNIAFYKVHFILNRDVIERIHEKTLGFTTRDGHTTNTQTLANLLVVLEEHLELSDNDIYRNEETAKILYGADEAKPKKTLNIDKHMAVGVAAGYLNLTASMLGYSTGCCACFDAEGVKNILNLENYPLLLMGIGHKDPSLNRRIHHLNHDFVFPTKTKQSIIVNIIR